MPHQILTIEIINQLTITLFTRVITGEYQVFKNTYTLILIVFSKLKMSSREEEQSDTNESRRARNVGKKRRRHQGTRWTRAKKRKTIIEQEAENDDDDDESSEQVGEDAIAELPDGIHSILSEYYYNPKNVASLTGSPQKLFKSIVKIHPEITFEHCIHFLHTQSPYTLTKTPYTFIKRNKMEIFRIFQLIQFDILVFQSFMEAEQKSVSRYCLIIVDGLKCEFCL